MPTKQQLLLDAAAMLAMLVLAAMLPLSDRIGHEIVSELSTTLPAQTKPTLSPRASNASVAQLELSARSTVSMEGAP